MSKAIETLFAAQKEHQWELRRSSAKQRMSQLKRLRDAIRDRSEEIQKALYDDFRKAYAETELTEIYPTIAEINHTLKFLEEWMAPRQVDTPLALVGTQSEIISEPKGVVLIIGPWNYPFHLMIAPLVAAISAGNCAVLKPSEFAAKTSALIKRMVQELFDEKQVTVVEGGQDETQQLLKLPFDHVFFTGSTRVGRIVMEAAAKHLASVTLELGGKSPAIIDRKTDISVTTERVAWGKFVNAGQTCVAPDYVLIPKGTQKQFVQGLEKAIQGFYGTSAQERKESSDLARIINDKHFERLSGLLKKSQAAGAKIALGGETDAASRYISPTVLVDVDYSNPVMAEEIFGPILPVIEYSSRDEMIQWVRSKDKPLALYVFSDDTEFQDRILSELPAGGSCVNHTLLHLANPELPFGGVGPSGMGSYHGEHGFRAFSHERAVMRQKRISPVKWMMPPYQKRAKSLIGLVSKYLG